MLKMNVDFAYKMVVKLLLSQVVEVYDLGKIRRPVNTNTGKALRWGKVVVYYEKTPKFDNPISEPPERPNGTVEEVAFWGAAFYPGFYPQYECHPYLLENRERYGAVVKCKATDGTITRHMSIPTNVRRGEYTTVPWDITKWEKAIIWKLRELPDHVRDVYGL